MKVLTRITHTMKEAPSGKSVWPEAGRVARTELPSAGTCTAWACQGRLWGRWEDHAQAGLLQGTRGAL